MGRPIGLDLPYKAMNSALGATCSFATNVMTCTVAPSTGAFAVGQTITAAGVAAGTTIVDFQIGNGGTGTYLLSTTPGTIAAEAVTGTGTVSYFANMVAVAAAVDASNQIVAGAPTGCSGGQASFATNVMTLTVAPTSGGVQAGQSVTAVGVQPGTQIAALLSGTWNAVGSTYSLSTTPGTIAAEAFTTLSGGAPLGIIVQNTDYTMAQNPVVRVGGTIDAVIGAAVNPVVERRLTFNAAGQVIPFPTGTPGIYPQVGLANEAGSTAGDLIEIQILPDLIYVA